jgi:hypothetical protein
LAGEWIVSHHNIDGRKWTYMQRFDLKKELAWAVGSLDDGQEHGWYVERKRTFSGDKMTMKTRDDEKAWSITKEPGDAS